MKRVVAIFLFICLSSAGGVSASEPVDEQVVARVKAEAFQNSRVMETVSYLTDVYGPRLSGSPALKAAEEWVVKRLTEWGLSNARREPWGTFGRGWSVKRYSIEMVAPHYMQIIAMPKAWTPSTNGKVSGVPVLVSINSMADAEKYRGKLRGRIVLNGKPGPPNPHFQPDATRMTDQALKKFDSAMNPGEPRTYWKEDDEWRKMLAERDAISRFFRDEGVAVLLEPSQRDHGVVRVGPQSYNINGDDGNFPAAVIAREHFGRLARMLEKNVEVRLEVNIETQFHTGDTTGYNVIAELPGSDPRLKDEVVILGAHLDSWHAGTGATDNAAGCAVMMEAMRILRALGLRPRRTIRIALWSGEEQSYFGSYNYVKNHFADPETMQLKPDHEKVAGYFNLDNGTGKIRGVYLQGNEAVRPIFEAYLKPFAYLGAQTLTIENAGGTDHMPFEAVGLPGFQFIQDQIEYTTRTHHTNLDVYEAVLEDDLKQAAAIVATFAYHTAMRDQKLPRKPLPKARAGAANGSR